jgi:hypothetical protein
MHKILSLLNFIPLTFREKTSAASITQARLKRAQSASLKIASVKWHRPALFVIAGLNSLLLVSYLFGVNSYSASGYEIRQMQFKVSELSEQNRKLKVKFAEANSITSLQQRFENSDFVSIENPLFLEVRHFSQK